MTDTSNQEVIEIREYVKEGAFKQINKLLQNSSDIDQLEGLEYLLLRTIKIDDRLSVDIRLYSEFSLEGDVYNYSSGAVLVRNGEEICESSDIDFQMYIENTEYLIPCDEGPTYSVILITQ